LPGRISAMFRRRPVQWGLGTAMVLLLGGIFATCATWWIGTYDEFRKAKLVNSVQVGMTESEVESILGGKSKPYQVLGRYVSRPGSRLVYWDRLSEREKPKVLLVEFDRNGRVLHMVVLDGLMAIGPAKQEVSLIGRLHALVGQ